MEILTTPRTLVAVYLVQTWTHNLVRALQLVAAVLVNYPDDRCGVPVDTFHHQKNCLVLCRFCLSPFLCRLFMDVVEGEIAKSLQESNQLLVLCLV